MTVEQRDNSVVVTADGRYTHADGRYVTTIDDRGRVSVSYDFGWTGEPRFDCFSWGYALQVAEPVDTLVWERDAQWSVYPDDHIGRRDPAGHRRTASLHYSAAREALGPPADESIRGDMDRVKPWPWSQDLVRGNVTNDFRSTKQRFTVGGLVTGDGDGVGVRLSGDGTSHLQAVPVGDELGGETFELEFHPDSPDRKVGRWMLQQLEFYQGSSEPHLLKSIQFDELRVEPGVRFNGTVSFRLTGAND